MKALVFLSRAKWHVPTVLVLGLVLPTLAWVKTAQAQPNVPLNWRTLQLQPSAPFLPPAPAMVTVVVPPDAKVFFDGRPTTQGGSERLFQTPVLPYGRRFSYQVTARWNENGKSIEQTREIQVSAGAGVRVDFTTVRQAYR
jgi:uncharacterized protein (TIGR03000 family)